MVAQVLDSNQLLMILVHFSQLQLAMTLMLQSVKLVI